MSEKKPPTPELDEQESASRYFRSKLTTKKHREFHIRKFGRPPRVNVNARTRKPKPKTTRAHTRTRKPKPTT
jgi:hypothetical protein